MDVVFCQNGWLICALQTFYRYFGRLARQRTHGNGGKRLTNNQLEAFYNRVSVEIWFELPTNSMNSNSDFVAPQFFSTDKVVVTRKEVDDACGHATIPPPHVAEIFS